MFLLLPLLPFDVPYDRCLSLDSVCDAWTPADCDKKRSRLASGSAGIVEELRQRKAARHRSQKRLSGEPRSNDYRPTGIAVAESC